MIRRTVGSGMVIAVLVGALAGCGSSSSKAKPAGSSTTKPSASSTSTSTTAASTTTVVKPTTTTTPATPISNPVVPTDAQTAAKQFFAAWIAHDSAGLATNGTAAAGSQASAQYAHTSGAAWVFSNCQGAAGSQYCTWVRAAEDVVLRATNVSTPHLVQEFQYHALAPLDIAEQFVTAWEEGSTGALNALGTSQAATQAQALNAHRADGWQAPSACDGTAGSLYCTFTAGSQQLYVRVDDVNPPRKVIEFRFP